MAYTTALTAKLDRCLLATISESKSFFGMSSSTGLFGGMFGQTPSGLSRWHVFDRKIALAKDIDVNSQTDISQFDGEPVGQRINFRTHILSTVILASGIDCLLGGYSNRQGEPNLFMRSEACWHLATRPT